eukprot:1158600-Pelagomonas_calceolata.AAC.4
MLQESTREQCHKTPRSTKHPTNPTAVAAVALRTAASAVLHRPAQACVDRSSMASACSKAAIKPLLEGTEKEQQEQQALVVTSSVERHVCVRHAQP